MTYRSLTPTPANIPTSPETARSYARITRPILTLSGPRPKTEAEIIAAAEREARRASWTMPPAPAKNPARPRNTPKIRPKFFRRAPRPNFGLTYA